MGKRRGVYRVLVRTHEGKRQLGRPMDGRIILRWIFRVGCGGIDWFELAQDTERWPELVNELMNLRVPKNMGNFLAG